MKVFSVQLMLACLVTMVTSTAFGDAYDPPAGFYDSATGTGATLKAQLTTIMSTGHIQQNYGNFRFFAAATDQDPNNLSNILLVYNVASVPATWDSGATWNREHVWPQSRQPGSVNNSSTGNLGDPHALRPANPSINSSRGNKPFGAVDTTGTFRSLGTFYFPGDVDKGNIARSLFYSATRWSSLGLTLVNGVPSGNQMGDLQALIQWNYLDPPDVFERRRNQIIFADLPFPYTSTNNRNAYVDHPEFVWTIFGTFDNDSTLYVGGAPAGDGSSATLVDLGRVLVGSAVPADQAVTLNKDGVAPTYYDVQVVGGATSDRLGPRNAFEFDPGTAALNVGLSASTGTAGVVSGTVTIDNLDPSSGGAGQGSADGNDVITVELAVLNPAQGSFSSTALVTSTVAGFVATPDSGVQNLTVNIYNFGFNADQALLDLDGITDPTAPFGFLGGLQLGIGSTPATLSFSFDTTGQAIGLHTALVDIDVSDEDIPGETFGVLSLELDVNVVGTAGDSDGDGDVDLVDWAALASCLTGPGVAGSPTCQASFDFDLDTDIDLHDLGAFQTVFTGP